MDTAGEAATLRAGLVEGLRARGVIRHEEIAQAFAAVPREHFIPEVAREQGLDAVYHDEAIVTKKDDRGMPLSSSSQPAMMAEMLELLATTPGQRVLVVGAGTGYNAALLAHLVGPTGRVTTIEVDPQLAQRALDALDACNAIGSEVEVVVGDGRAGVLDAAPYDRIIVTACADQVSRPWLEQLTEAGRIVLPLRLDPDADAIQVIPALERHGSTLRSVDMTWGGFMPLHGGDGGWRGSPARLGASRLASGEHSSLASISGAGLERLSDHAARAVLADVLREPNPPRGRGSTALDGHTPLILIFLLSAIPARRRVWLRDADRYGIGLVDRRGRGLAAVCTQSTRSEPSALEPSSARWRLDAFGAGDDACHELLAVLAGWRELQRAGRRTLAISARPDGDAMALALEWH